MLRRARWLILLAILLLAGGVLYMFLVQRRVLRSHRPKASAPLAANISASAREWQYEVRDGERVKVLVKARNFEQIKEPALFQLEGLQMEVRDKSGTKHDLIKSERATFDTAAGTMYSDGDVEITKNLPEEGAPKGRLLSIQSSGVTFESKTSKVTTDRKAVFSFDQGGGESVGAIYDPNSRELILRSDVRLEWNAGEGPDRVMHIEAGGLLYKEETQEIFLYPWARLKRGPLTVDAADTVVLLKEGMIDRVEAKIARGSRTEPKRKLEFGADHLTLNFTSKGEIQSVIGEPGAQLNSLTATGETRVKSNRIDLAFATTDKDSILKSATANGKTVVESLPAGANSSPTRILTSEVVELQMRPGGEEIDQVITHTPGRIDFLPLKPTDRTRRLDGERLYITYGDQNRVRRFRAVNVTTQTTTPQPKGRPASISTTKSTDFEADFDPKSGEMSHIAQWGNFEYEEEKHRAKADRADMDVPKDVITLQTKARVWDDTGSTSADRIVMDQRSGNTAAYGNVASTRLADKKQPPQGGLLSAGEPMHARANRLFTTNRNQILRYEENVLLWQAATRLEASTAVIDREKGTLEATGDVVTTIPDQSSTDGKNQKKAGLFTVVRSQKFVYVQSENLATYTGGVQLERQGLDVKSSVLRAWFVEVPKGKDSRETQIDRLFADGAVEIVDRTPERTRKGNAEHAEYYIADEKIVLNEGSPVISDSKRGVSRGRLITWFAKQDRLIVDNTGGGPAVTRIQRK